MVAHYRSGKSTKRFERADSGCCAEAFRQRRENIYSSILKVLSSELPINSLKLTDKLLISDSLSVQHILTILNALNVCAVY